MKTMTSGEQMELSFRGVGGPRLPVRRSRRMTRARWWFERMRQAVDRAIDWQPAMPPKPEQTWLGYR